MLVVGIATYLGAAVQLDKKGGEMSKLFISRLVG
jgi:hypothetical protein